MIYRGDCLNILTTFDANSVDAVVTDPPYGLSFMGKDWDKGVPGVSFWEAASRVMRPGAFLLAFGGTRTHHRLTCAIEDAGFEIRVCMMWLYGSGFPKSHDVSKAIDKAAGNSRKSSYVPNFKNNDYGKGMGGGEWNAPSESPIADAARQWSGWGTALKPAWEPIIVARKPLEGTVAENVLKWGTGGLNIDGCRIGSSKRTPGYANPQSRMDTTSEWNKSSLGLRREVDVTSGRWPANVILDEEAGEMLDGQSGISKSPKPYQYNGKLSGGFSNGNVGKGIGHDKEFGDSGGASRFFYCAKASKRERGDGNNHPTVKPLSLLRYLLKLVCPPNGTVLDPFMGSGSTLLAAKQLGLQAIGIDIDEAYCAIASQRMTPESRVFEAAV